jgi:hypothetical protein
MPDTDVGGLFDSVGVVASSFDDAGVGAVSSWGVEVAAGGDARCDRDMEALVLFRGEKPPS